MPHYVQWPLLWPGQGPVTVIPNPVLSRVSAGAKSPLPPSPQYFYHCLSKAPLHPPMPLGRRQGGLGAGCGPGGQVSVSWAADRLGVGGLT